jgi:hypothetical protein
MPFFPLVKYTALYFKPVSTYILLPYLGKVQTNYGWRGEIRDNPLIFLGNYFQETVFEIQNYFKVP